MTDLTFDCPECAHTLVVDAQAAGLVVACPECGTQIRVPNPEAEPEAVEPAVPDAVAAATPDAEPAAAPEMAAVAAMPEYRVVSLIESDGIAGKITADGVEFKLNELRQEGWRLRSATTIRTRDAQGEPRQELLLIMERQI
jgi:DNA-directed RNA polymerase subunit M/transcription elongation factor TFIIS